MPSLSASSSRDLLRRLDESPFTVRHGRIYATVLAGHFLCGFVINLTGVIVPGALRELHFTKEQAGLLATALFAGMLVGAAAAGSISDRLGRKVPLACCLLVFAIFSLAAAFATSYGALVTFRAVQGIGLGAEIAVVLPYIAEFVPSRHRGPLVTTATAAWLIGLPAAAAIGAAVVPTFGWRAMFVIGALLPALAGVVMLVWVPESVRYLIHRGRLDDAHVIVGSLCPDQPGPDPAAPAPATHPEESVTTAAGALRLLVERRYLRYTVAIWLMELCAGAFLYGLSTWLPSVLADQGANELESFGYTAIITAVGVVGSILAGRLINRVGRRPVLGIAFVLSGLFCLAWGTTSSSTAAIVLGSAATFFGSGLAGSTLFAYVSELYPTAARATGLGWAAAWQKVGGLVMPPVLGVVLAAGLPTFVFFLLFGVISVIAGIAAFAATFETRGRTVEQITRALDTERPAPVRSTPVPHPEPLERP